MGANHSLRYFWIFSARNDSACCDIYSVLVDLFAGTAFCITKPSWRIVDRLWSDRIPSWPPESSGREFACISPKTRWSKNLWDRRKGERSRRRSDMRQSQDDGLIRF